jgi:hypothetical protein
MPGVWIERESAPTADAVNLTPSQIPVLGAKRDRDKLTFCGCKLRTHLPYHNSWTDAISLATPTLLS